MAQLRTPSVAILREGFRYWGISATDSTPGHISTNYGPACPCGERYHPQCDWCWLVYAHTCGAHARQVAEATNA